MNIFKNTLNNIFQVIGEQLSENAIVEIDHIDFGKLFANNSQVLFDPLNEFASGSSGKTNRQGPHGLWCLKQQCSTIILLPTAVSRANDARADVQLPKPRIKNAKLNGHSR